MGADFETFVFLGVILILILQVYSVPHSIKEKTMEVYYLDE